MGNDRQVASGPGAKLDSHRQIDHTGTVVVSDEETHVGESVTIAGRNLPENEPLDVVWHSAHGGWGVIRDAEIVGPQFHPRTDRVMTVSTDDAGAFTTEWEVPEDYGGEHRIELQTVDERTVAQTRLTIRPWFEIADIRIPLGETLRITGYGLGPNMITNNYQIAWDNGTIGVMTGTMNRGTATARIRAAGPIGSHLVQVWRNLAGVPFLQNNTQSPFGPVSGGRQSSWEVEVVAPNSDPKPAWVDPLTTEAPLAAHYEELAEETMANLTISPTCGQAGTSAFIRGRDFPPETTVDLVWYTHVGLHVAGVPITPEPRPDVLPTVTSDERGAFSVEVTIPNGAGATRPIAAEVDGRSIAVTGFMMQPKIVGFEPTSGPAGTEIEISLTGIGWPKYENAYFFVYDNRPLGYVCGVDRDEYLEEDMRTEEGIVRTVLRAAGSPGYHFIDAYPCLYEHEEDLPDFQKKAHLSYIDNHPVRPLPGLHFTFEITE